MHQKPMLPVFLLTIVLGCGQGQSLEPPVCTSRFDHDFKVLQKLAELDFEMKLLKSELSKLKGDMRGSCQCLDDWVVWEGKFYLFRNERETYDGAQEKCIIEGGKLAEPMISTTNEFLKRTAQQFKATNSWFGLNDTISEGEWAWSSDGGSPRYSDWEEHRPNQKGQGNCGALWEPYSYKWADATCGNTQGRVCLYALYARA